MFVIALTFTAGCATMPEPIKDVLLIRATQEQQNEIYKIEDEIIAIKKEKDAIEKSYEAAKLKVEETKKDIKTLESQKSQIHEKMKTAAKANEQEKVNAGQKEMEDKDRLINNENITLRYRDAKETHEKALLEVKNAQLALKIGERETLRAKIARAYQDSIMVQTQDVQPAEGGEKKKTDEGIDVKKYEEWVLKKQQQFNKRLDDKNKASEKLGQAELQLEDIKK